MSDKTLASARGLNSIADPKSFRGTSGRARPKSPEPVEVKEPEIVQPEATKPITADLAPATVVDITEPEAEVQKTEIRVAPRIKPRKVNTAEPGSRSSAGRTRRELSIPLPVHEALVATKLNPTDVVLRALRNHRDAIAAGDFARGVDRGRKRLRLSMNDAEFDKITRLGEGRGWNRSETVAVLLSAELET